MLNSMPNDIPASLRQRARYQAGVVTREQAFRAGLTPAQVNWALERGWWQRVHRGAYATFTGPISREALLWAAVLYAGRGAYLSHETAAELNRLTDQTSPVIHVTVPADRRVTPPRGVVIHLSAHEAMTFRPPGIPPYAVPAQTVIDLAQCAISEDEVIALVTGGFSRRLLAESHLREVARQYSKLRWRRELDEVIRAAAAGAHSLLEYRYDRDVQRAHRLPEPVRQAPFRKLDGTRGYRDRYYPGFGLVVELDGQRFHPVEGQDRDTERDNQAAVAGATLRYGWDAVTRHPCDTAGQLAQALRNRGWSGALVACSPACRAVGRAVRPGQLSSARSTTCAPAASKSRAG
jgi:Transcriptional regulator, AbiEi antitoxin